MIEFKHIEIKYGDFVAIRDLNLTIGDGEFFTFLGPSGLWKDNDVTGSRWFSGAQRGTDPD